MKGLSRYRKTLAALVGGVLAWAQTAYVPDGRVDRAEWYGLAVVLAMAAGVYGIANDAPKDEPEDKPAAAAPEPAQPAQLLPQPPDWNREESA